MDESAVTNQLEGFFSSFSAFSFKTGDILLATDQPADSIFYLKSGFVAQITTSQQGQEITLTHYKPGAFFPLIWALHGARVPYDFVAVTNGAGWRAPAPAVSEFLQSHPDVSFHLILRLLSGLEGMSRKLQYALSEPASARLRDALQTLAYRFGVENERGVEIELNLTHRELAAQTGLSRETITRELKTLKEQGVIEIQGGSCVVMREKIQ
jgi:CRP-like cAMP-binding protein